MVDEGLCALTKVVCTMLNSKQNVEECEPSGRQVYLLAIRRNRKNVVAMLSVQKKLCTFSCNGNYSIILPCRGLIKGITAILTGELNKQR